MRKEKNVDDAICVTPEEKTISNMSVSLGWLFLYYRNRINCCEDSAAVLTLTRENN